MKTPTFLSPQQPVREEAMIPDVYNNEWRALKDQVIIQSLCVHDARSTGSEPPCITAAAAAGQQEECREKCPVEGDSEKGTHRRGTASYKVTSRRLGIE